MRNDFPFAFICGVLLSICLAASACAFDKVPVLRIDAMSDPPLEIGQQSKTLFPDITQRYDKHLASILSQTAFNNILRNRLSNLLEHQDSDYQRERQGISSVWMLSNHNKLGDGLLSVDEYRLLNLLPDIFYPPMASALGW